MITKINGKKVFFPVGYISFGVFPLPFFFFFCSGPVEAAATIALLAYLVTELGRRHSSLQISHVIEQNKMAGLYINPANM